MHLQTYPLLRPPERIKKESRCRILDCKKGFSSKQDSSLAQRRIIALVSHLSPDDSGLRATLAKNPSIPILI